MTRLTAIDLFAGCGGLSLGLEQAGVDVRWANELDGSAASTYRRSHPGTTLFEEDADELVRRMMIGGPGIPQPGEVDLVAGGPPCQGFSGYNRYRSVQDPRNSSIETFLNFVRYLKPRFVLIENVPGMLSLNDGGIPRLLFDALGQFNYQARLGIVQAGYYGLPQNRWRIFIWAAAGSAQLPHFPEPTHDFPRITIHGATRFREAVVRKPPSHTLFWNLSPMVTVRDAISDLPTIENGGGADIAPYGAPPQSAFQMHLRGSETDLTDHRCPRLTGIQLERCRAVPHGPNSGWWDLPNHLKPLNLLRHGDLRYRNRFGRLRWDGSFNTIVTKAEPYWGAVFHPDQDRVMSVREAARAQGFPDRVQFSGGLAVRYRQVGNAVPPPLARALGVKLLEVADVAA
jgi:DNA (cytosine-5)-methyltransferase 1